jgi:hypothetical protein
MSTATVMRLVPEENVPRALAVLNGGNALATTVAALAFGKRDVTGILGTCWHSGARRMGNLAE